MINKFTLFLILLSLFACECHSQISDFDNNLKFECEGKKCLGLDFSFRYPTTWKQIDGDRPHVVSKVFSENGKGLQGLVITLYNEPNFVNASLKDLSSSVMPAGSKLVSYNDDIMIDGCKAVSIIFTSKSKKLDIEIDTRYLVYIFKYSERVFIMNFVTMDNENSFNSYLPLFKKIALSFTITSKYR